MNLSPNNRAIRSKSEFWARFEALEKGLELQQRRSNFATDTIKDAILMAVEAFRFLRESPEWRQLVAGELKIPLRLDRWPKSFARILIDGKVKCDESRREAVRRYLVVLDDLQRHENLLQSSPPEQHNDWTDSVTRWRRQLNYQRDTLRNLDVTINDELVGLPFDPSRHEPTGTVPTANDSEVDTIAAVQRSLFSWTDENGTAQCVPALVVLFAKEST